VAAVQTRSGLPGGQLCWETPKGSCPRHSSRLFRTPGFVPCSGFAPLCYFNDERARVCVCVCIYRSLALFPDRTWAATVMVPDGRRISSEDEDDQSNIISGEEEPSTCSPTRVVQTQNPTP